MGWPHKRRSFLRIPPSLLLRNVVSHSTTQQILPIPRFLPLPHSDYAAKVFGFATFGSVYGTIICLSGLCTFIQFPLQAVTHAAFDDNPSVVNLVLTGLGAVIGVVLVVYVEVRGRAVRREQEQGLLTETGRQSLLAPSILETIEE